MELEQKNTLQEKIVNMLLFSLLAKTHCVLYGGAIRDMVSGDKINDFDLIISKKHLCVLDTELKKMGYDCEKDEDKETLIYSAKNCIPLEVYAVEEDPEDVQITPESSLDFNVNSLAYNFASKSLFVWNIQGNEQDVLQVIDSIKKKEAIVDKRGYQHYKMLSKLWFQDLGTLTKRQFPKPHRVEKIEKRGYKVIYPSD